ISSNRARQPPGRPPEVIPQTGWPPVCGGAPMAQKTQEKGVTGPAPVVDQPGRVRNVVLVGHSGAGKTTLVEALLAATGTIARAGDVTEGTTVSDYDPAAVRQQRSVSLSCAPIVHEGIKVNLLDTPGY